MEPIKLIGMGISLSDLSPTHLETIRQADILVGGQRHLSCFKNIAAVKREITGDLKRLFQYIKRRRHRKRIVVLASGDPLFYGIGARLIDEFGADHVDVLPNLSAVAVAFSRLKIPWSDVRIVSLHGQRRISEVFDALKEKDVAAVYTDPRHHPAWLADRLIEYGCSNIEMCVLEQLGMPEERIGWYDLQQVRAMHFAEPNLVVLKRMQPAVHEVQPLYLGTPDHCFEHERGLITKSEIRAVTLSKLCLKSHHILWDLGAGSGSISLEAALFIKRGKIYAVEQHKYRIAQIRRNKKRFQVKNLFVVHAVLPQGIDTLPKPDRIFIGGGGRQLKSILEAACRHLAPQGIIVINTVLIENIDIACATLKALDFDLEFVQIQVHRNRSMPWGDRLEAQNPIWIISGSRKTEVHI
jgi:precorrin-6B C5,15-methyltransferase / cobalt-precorrin-6B C5,C15-methyltransferase